MKLPTMTAIAWNSIESKATGVKSWSKVMEPQHHGQRQWQRQRQGIMVTVFGWKWS
jgi:hypothetical protein